MKSLVLILISTYGIIASATTTKICGYVDNFSNSQITSEKHLKKENSYPLIIVSKKTREQYELVNTDDILDKNPDLENGSTAKLFCIVGEFVGDSKLRIISWKAQ